MPDLKKKKTLAEKDKETKLYVVIGACICAGILYSIMLYFNIINEEEFRRMFYFLFGLLGGFILSNK